MIIQQCLEMCAQTDGRTDRHTHAIVTTKSLLDIFRRDNKQPKQLAYYTQPAPLECRAPTINNLWMVDVTWYSCDSVVFKLIPGLKCLLWMQWSVPSCDLLGLVVDLISGEEGNIFYSLMPIFFALSASNKLYTPYACPPPPRRSPPAINYFPLKHPPPASHASSAIVSFLSYWFIFIFYYCHL